ncbi:unnamed protein product [Haemonchus placei]|uniref:DUF148 domain-containing protein n=1 Tax=Haemonchus placei TaxID=6290 RepID=A0A0N4WMG3_HAEPC|nr:unnamed protein product [Haemonchus placei]
MKLLILLFITITAAHHLFPLEELHHPPFLNDVSRKAQKHYYKILFNEKLSIAEQKGMITVWAKKNNVTEEVKSFYGRIGKRMEETNEKLAKLIGALPMALKNFTAIMKNENQTVPQMMMAVEALKAEHPSVFHVLMSAMKEVMHEHGPYGPHEPHPWTHGEPFPFDGHRPWFHHWEMPWHRRPVAGPFGGRWNSESEHEASPFGREDHWNKGRWHHERFDGSMPSMDFGML